MRRAQLDPRYAVRRAFAEHVGLNHGLIRDIETAVRDNYRPSTLAAIESAYQWESGSIQRVLAGQEPIPLESAGRPEATSTQATASATVAGEDTGQTITLQTERPRRLPRWLSSEAERRGIDIAALVESINDLRGLASHFGYTLGEILIQANLATEDDLATCDLAEERKNNLLAEFDAEAGRILADPGLTRGQRRDVERTYRKLRADLEKAAGPPEK